MEVIYIIIAVAAAGVGYFVYGRYFKENRDTHKISDSTAPVSKVELVTEPVSTLVVDTVSIDQRYADDHGMWVCIYCETLNEYPAGMAVRRITAEEARADIAERTSGLRGDLLNKANISDHGPAGASDILTCTACGKHQFAAST